MIKNKLISDLEQKTLSIKTIGWSSSHPMVTTKIMQINDAIKKPAPPSVNYSLRELGNIKMLQPGELQTIENQAKELLLIQYEKEFEKNHKILDQLKKSVTGFLLATQSRNIKEAKNALNKLKRTYLPILDLLLKKYFSKSIEELDLTLKTIEQIDPRKPNGQKLIAEE